MNDDHRPIPRAVLAAYAAPAVPLSMLMMQLIVYVPPFYASEMAMDLGTVGLVFFLARAWDALIDPLIGNLSDRTSGRFGRRKPWLGLGTPALALLAWLFCQPPEGVGVVYLGVVALFFYVALASLQIPYLSWGSELSGDYRERTRINGWREAGGMLGTLLATGLPLLLLADEDPSLREILFVFTLGVAVLLPLTVGWALRAAPSRAAVAPEHRSLRVALAGARRNAPLRRLLLGVFLFWLAGAVWNALVLFVVQFTLDLPRSAFLWFVFAQYLCSILCLPFATALGNRIGRHRALVFGAIAYFAFTPLFLLAGKAAFLPAMLIFLLMGAVTPFIWVMPPALVADAVEHGMLQGEAEDAALYMALYFFVQKAALAAGVGIALPLSAVLGFDPASGAGQNGLALVALGLPLLIALPAAAIMFNYPIDERRHAEIRRALVERGIVRS
ncbi:MAG: MFS transporter [Gammaproteobacteria bacterium]